MAVEVFNRYEHKYLISEKDFLNMTKILNEKMVADPYNRDGKPYTIANIYFDTHDDFLVRNSLSKPAYKEKLRLRSYGVPDENAKVYLEIKKKFRGLVNKRRTALSLFEAYNFTKTSVPPIKKDYMNGQVVKEIQYFLNVYDLSPKVYLAYDRYAFFEKGNDDLRISFDTNIRSRRYDLRLEKGDYGEKLLNEGLYLMEIKTSLSKPLWLTKMLSDFDIKRISFSKYGTEFTKNLRKTAI